MSLTVGVSDYQLAVKLTATQTAVVSHCTCSRVLPLIYELFTYSQQMAPLIHFQYI